MTDVPYSLSQLNQGFLLSVTKDTVVNTAANPHTDQLPMVLPNAKGWTRLLDVFLEIITWNY